MHKTLALFTLPVCLVAALPAQAQDNDLTSITHTYVEAYALSFAFDTSGAGENLMLGRDISGDGDGYTVGGQLDIPDIGELQHFTLVGRYTDATYDDALDYTAYRAGIGYFLNPKDLPTRFTGFTHLQYESQEFGDGGGEANEDDGYSLTVGTLFYAGDQRLQFGISGGWVDLGDPQGFRFTASGYVELPWKIYAGVEYESQSLSQDFETAAEDNVDERYRNLRLGLRKTF